MGKGRVVAEMAVGVPAGVTEGLAKQLDRREPSTGGKLDASSCVRKAMLRGVTQADCRLAIPTEWGVVGGAAGHGGEIDWGEMGREVGA